MANGCELGVGTFHSNIIDALIGIPEVKTAAMTIENRRILPAYFFNQTNTYPIPIGERNIFYFVVSKRRLLMFRLPTRTIMRFPDCPVDNS